MFGLCRLCGEPGELQESHVIPSFVYKWLKETSATGFLRFSDAPNKRVQDGYKEHWLCLPCEQRLNVWETQFATDVFHPLSMDGGQRVKYEAWMMKFCASISWRALLKIQESDLAHFAPSQKVTVNQALDVWSKVMLDKLPHPGRYEQHLLPLDSIVEDSSGALPANINRYIQRTVGMDAVRSESTAFVFTKMSKFLVLGFIEVPHPRQWVGTKIHVRAGTVGMTSYSVPIQLRDYLADKANSYASLVSNISETQRSKIEQAARKDLDRVARSRTFDAMRNDVELSGHAAFDVHKPNGKR
jgi:hypothetical protein